MSHLHPSEFIDLLDGTLPPERQAHARECERCRNEAASLAEATTQTRDVSVPEPSPLFWEHFSARVRAGVDQTRADDPATDETSWFHWLTRPAVALAATAAIAIAAVAWYAGDRSANAPAGAVTSEQAITAKPEVAPALAPADEAGWDLVAAAAEDLSWEEGALPDALAVRPGAAERAVAALSDQQREELAALLRAEIDRTKS